MEATRDLGPSLKGGELNYVCDKATLEELKVALEVVRDQRLTKLSYTTKLTPAIVQKDIDSFAKARNAGSRSLFSAYVLGRTCMLPRLPDDNGPTVKTPIIRVLEVHSRIESEKFEPRGQSRQVPTTIIKCKAREAFLSVLCCPLSAIRSRLDLNTVPRSEVVGERVQKSLEELSLEGMPVGRWMKTLSLNLTSSLRKLSLRHCRIGDDGCQVLQKTGLSTSLKEIDLTGNAIADTGCRELAKLLGSQSFRRVVDPGFQGLQKVVLNYNDIGIGGLSAIVDVLLDDFWIKSVELRNCQISSTGDSLRLALVNRVIQVFDLRENPVSDVGVVNEIARILTTRHPHETSDYAWKDRENLITSIPDAESQ